MRSVMVVTFVIDIFLVHSGSDIVIDRVHERVQRALLDTSYGSPAYRYCECGRKNVGDSMNTRIYGGNVTSPNEYPWMALILVNATNLVGGGTLINDRYILTAAHYLDLGQANTKVVLGEYDRCTFDTRTVTLSVEQFFAHPNFRAEDNYADLMLIKLNMRVTFNEFIRPICLPKAMVKQTRDTRYVGEPASVLGWGQTIDALDVCTLRIVSMIVYTRQSCRTNVPTMICAGRPMLDGYDACQGDSGGPLQIRNAKHKYELIGIVSTGIGCGEAEYPGLYTDVVRYIPWIHEITYADSMYCWR